MPHGDAIVDGNGVELGRKTALLLNILLHQLSYLMQMHMSGHKLSEGVDHRDDGLAHLFAGHPVGMPERSRPCHQSSLRARRTAQAALVFPGTVLLVYIVCVTHNCNMISPKKLIADSIKPNRCPYQAFS